MGREEGEEVWEKKKREREGDGREEYPIRPYLTVISYFHNEEFNILQSQNVFLKEIIDV